MYPASARRPKDGGSRLHSRLHLAQRTTDDRTAEHQTLDPRRDDLYGTGLRKHSSSGLSLLAAVKRSFKRKFDQRNEPVKWRTQSDVLHLLLQKNKTVFHREAPFQHVWVTAISISCSPVVSFKVTVHREASAPNFYVNHLSVKKRRCLHRDRLLNRRVKFEATVAIFLP